MLSNFLGKSAMVERKPFQKSDDLRWDDTLESGINFISSSKCQLKNDYKSILQNVKLILTIQLVVF